MTDTAGATDQPTTRQVFEGRIARVLGLVPGAWLLRLIGEKPLVLDGLTLDPHVQFILASRKGKLQPVMAGPNPVEARLRNRREIRAAAVRAGARPTRVRAVQRVTVDGATGPLEARHYLPIASGRDAAPPLLVYFHGGGFVICDLETHDEACRILCSVADVQVLSVAYRLAPEHPFPAAVDDCYAALRWAQHNAASLGADPSCITVGGDSAGGNLAAVAALTVAREGNAVAAQLLIYPATDATQRYPSRSLFAAGFVLTSADMDEFMRLYLLEDPTLHSDPRVSPALASDLATSPPTLVITAGFDPLRDEGEAYAETLRHAGVPVRLLRMSALVHGFLHMTTVVPAAQKAMSALAKEFRALLNQIRSTSPTSA